MGHATPAARRAVSDPTAGLRARIDELHALVPELPSWSGDGFPPEAASALLDLIERKQRQLIQFNVRLAGLRELTETLLRDPEEERVLRSISLYLGHAYGLPEVAVLTRTTDGGVRGYRSRAVGRGLCEAVRWSAETLKGTAWERALDGETILAGVEADEAPPGTPPPLPLILPLTSSSDGEDGNESVMGLLGLRPDPGLKAGLDRLEVEQIVFQAATLFESVRHHRSAIQETQFRECLFQAMGDGLVATDPAGKVTAVNRAALEMLGSERAAVLGQPIERLQGQAPQLVDALRGGTSDPPPETPREAWVQNGKDRIPISLTVVPFDAERGEPGGFVMTLADLRPLRRMEEELRRLDRLAALGRFATAVAHEIRNPLAAIGAGIEYMSRDLPAERGDEIQMLRSEIGRLDRIVRDLLEPARNQPLDRRRIRVSGLVQRACKAVEPLARERRQQFTIRPSIEEAVHPAVVEVDEERLLQVLINLVRNAVEASAEGGEVEIGWEHDRAESPPLMRIWVRDLGSGIPQEALARIFEPFFSTKAGGTGLGLYVSHCVVDQHGGKLVADSAADRGTCMTICLPISPA